MASMGTNFRCVKPCSKTFGSQRGLTKHQDTCTIFHHVIGIELFDAVQKEEEANRDKRRRLDETLAVHIMLNHSEDTTQIGIDVEMKDSGPPVIEAVPMPSVGHIDEGPAAEEIEELGRGKRKKWRTKKYIDPRYEPPAPLPELDVGSPIAPAACTTARNANGVYRVYVSRPTYFPDEFHLDPSCPQDDSEERTAPYTSETLDGPTSFFDADQSETIQRSWFAPFPNASTFRLMKWFWTGSQNKSIADLQALADTVLKADDFMQQDLVSFNAKAENRRLDKWAVDAASFESESTVLFGDNWIEASVDIQLPTRTKHLSETDIPLFTIPGLLYKPIVEVIKTAFQSKDAYGFHYTPFKQYWQPDDAQTPCRIYDELYTGDAWLKLHADIQELPRDEDDKYERVVAGLMLWSDSTHVANFGNASLWPLYLFFGNQPKSERSKPASQACRHIAYFPTLPDSVSDFYKQLTGGKRPTTETLTHCKRELMHSALAVIFGEDFTKASKEGLLLRCVDGIMRRIYPRIITYSADYPEKVLLSSIRFLSLCPCPRCLVKKAQSHQLGSPENETTAMLQARQDSLERQESVVYSRNLIYRDGRGVKCSAIEALLASSSLVPTSEMKNVFSKVMWTLGYNFYEIFVVDLLHEIELGVWKALIVHLIRILMVCAEDSILLLNERYRQISTFGRDTIRKFTSDTSSLKKLAARDYEDLLLCSMPTFEGLFPGHHDAIVQNLLFSLLTWHALAKLHVHTDKTLVMLQTAKRRLGMMLRTFQNTTCQAYETRELPSERARRERREARKTAASKLSELQPPKDSTKEATASNNDTTSRNSRESKRKRFNMNTYKFHAPEHYHDNIVHFGTVDSYSTQRGEFEHRTVKSYYSRTNKHNPLHQITKIERREQLLRQISLSEPDAANTQTIDDIRSFGSSSTTSQLDDHHVMSNSRNFSIHLPTWLRQHIQDPATKSFRRKLKDHFLERLLKISHDCNAQADFSDVDRKFVQIEYDRLYMHKVLRVNYTNYDGQRKQDTINPRTHGDVLVLSADPQDKHPYLYARIIHMFHAIVRHIGPRSTTEGVPVKMQSLWVRWFTRTDTLANGSHSRHLTALTFLADSDINAFGFLDPSDVIRGVHLLPVFCQGKTDRLLQPGSIARQATENNEDWNNYYINRFVDRDMFLRYNGCGIGHAMLKLDGQLDDPDFGIYESNMTMASGCFESDNSQARRQTIIDLENDEINSEDEDRRELEQEESSDSNTESGSEAGVAEDDY